MKKRMAFLLFAFVILAVCAILAVLALRASRRRDRGQDVIRLGYDDQDNVGSLRSAMLKRLQSGDLDI